MTPEQITAAYDSGRCDALLGVDPLVTEARRRAEAGESIDADDVAVLRRGGHHDLITAAYEAGRINLTKEN